VLIQIKGGGAKRPNAEDIQRLKAVASYHHAKPVVLTEWKKGGQPQFSRLDLKSLRWGPTDPGELFY
jgi:hypothetical protein